MLRKTLLTAGMTLAFASSAYASSLNGLYVGLGLGPDYASIQQNASISQVNSGILEFNARDTTQVAATGVFGTLFAGYGMFFTNPYIPCCKNLYLAAELNGNLSSMEHERKNTEYVHGTFSKTTYKMNSSYGISFLPGFLVTKSALVYARVGYSNANFKVSTSDISLQSIHKDLGGFRWGFGVKQDLMKQVSMRLDYSHVDYENAKMSALDTLSNTTKITHVTPHTNEVEASLIYNFA